MDEKEFRNKYLGQWRDFKRVAVIAGSASQFWFFADEMYETFKTLTANRQNFTFIVGDKEYFYANDARKCRGRRIDEVIRYGTWYNIPPRIYDEINATLKANMAGNR